MREKASRRTRQNVRVNFAFTVRGDGIIEAHAGSGDGLLDHARNDALSSRAPRGASSEGLSTYWIDRTEEALRRAIAEGHEKPFASGNATYLRLDGDHVVAAYDFDPDEREGESLPLGEFLSLLNEWRRRVVEAGGVSGQAAARMSEGTQALPDGPACVSAHRSGFGSELFLWRRGSRRTYASQATRLLHATEPAFWGIRCGQSSRCSGTFRPGPDRRSGARSVPPASLCVKVRLCGVAVQAHGVDYRRAVTGAREKPLMRAERASRH
jgi:hypothetical protein